MNYLGRSSQEKNSRKKKKKIRTPRRLTTLPPHPPPTMYVPTYKLIILKIPFPLIFLPFFTIVNNNNINNQYVSEQRLPK